MRRRAAWAAKSLLKTLGAAFIVCAVSGGVQHEPSINYTLSEGFSKSIYADILDRPIDFNIVAKSGDVFCGFGEDIIIPSLSPQIKEPLLVSDLNELRIRQVGIGNRGALNGRARTDKTRAKFRRGMVEIKIVRQFSIKNVALDARSHISGRGWARIFPNHSELPFGSAKNSDCSLAFDGHESSLCGRCVASCNPIGFFVGRCHTRGLDGIFFRMGSLGGGDYRRLTGGISRNSGSSIRSDQKDALPNAGNSQAAGKDRKPESKVRNGIVRGLMPKGFFRLTIGTFFLSALIAAALLGAATFVSRPRREPKREK